MTIERNRTQHRLEMALYRIQRGRGRIVKGDAKLTFANVAREAEVSTATIHNRYPEVAEKIRAAQGRTSRALRDQKNEQLRVARATIVRLRKELRDSNNDAASLASINRTLELEIRRLRAVMTGGGVATGKYN
ncbi:MAG: hypothetical protein KDG50_06395 [Chromatiales bacterium]|nr:hypothetical protein [Chromatiales bacterium]